MDSLIPNESTGKPRSTHTHFNTAPFFLGHAQCYFIMARGLQGKVEQKGKRKDDL